MSPFGSEVVRAESGRVTTGNTARLALTASETEIDLAGQTIKTWAYNGKVPGPELRAKAGDQIVAKISNMLPTHTSIHWHGMALRNDMDGVPPLTQDEIMPGDEFEYSFVAETPGTHWFHPHVGPQLDRGLYGPLIIEDPREPLTYDHEWVLVLDDWLDGVSSTPDDVLVELQSGGGMHGRGGMMGGRGSSSSEETEPRRNGNLLVGASSELLGGHAGDVYYPYFLINGRPKADPETFKAQPGARIRLRIINAAGDTAFRFAIGGHTLVVTHSDGYPVVHSEGESVLLGMGERVDALVTVGDGAFPVIAHAEGKADLAFAVLRTGTGTSPVPEKQLIPSGPILTSKLKASEESLIAERAVDRELRLQLTGGMMGYDWSIDGRRFDPDRPFEGALTVHEGERVRLSILNRTMMWHPFHLHGHTYQHEGAGPRKDTSVILPMQSLTVQFDADNPGVWMMHCHNIYHAETGMMAVLGYAQE